jgi:hypothetical protein
VTDVPEHGIDVDRMAEAAERLDLVSADMQGADEDAEADEVLVVVHIRGGLLADIGCRRRDTGRLRIVVVDEDVLEEDPERGYWTETPTAVENWPAGPTDPLCRARTELPADLVAALGIPDPTPRRSGDESRVPPTLPFHRETRIASDTDEEPTP